MKLRKFIDSDSDESVPADALYFDMYAIADRILEGFIVKIELINFGQELEITPLQPWPKGIDEAYWTEEVKRHALNGEELMASPDGDGEGYVDVDE